jgi:hypothetical protein
MKLNLAKVVLMVGPGLIAGAYSAATKTCIHARA